MLGRKMAYRRAVLLVLSFAIKRVTLVWILATLSLMATHQVATAETPFGDIRTGAKVISLLEGQWLIVGEFDRSTIALNSKVLFDGHGGVRLSIGDGELGGSGTYVISEDKLVIRATDLEAGWWIWGREVVRCDVSFLNSEALELLNCVGSGAVPYVSDSGAPEAFADQTYVRVQ